MLPFSRFHFLTFSLLSLLLAGCSTALRTVADSAPQSVGFSAGAFHDHIAYLASDELEGRGTGARGNDKAAEYIAAQFKRAGLTPAGTDGSYFQPFEVSLAQKLEGRSWLTISGAPGLGVLYQNYVPLPFSSNDAFAGPLAFAGYGITNKDANYDDFAGFDAKGKVLLIFRYEPHDAKPDAKFGGESPSSFATFERKARRAREAGAVALLIVNPPMHHGARDVLFAFDAIEGTPSYGIPMMHVSRELASGILAAASQPSLEELQKSLDDGRKSLSRDLPGVGVRGRPGLIREKAGTRNVVGVLPGRGRLADEYLVIGGHFDHLGIAVPRGSHAASQPAGAKSQIHNGADDNASGTAGVIMLAQRFAADAKGNPRGDRRSIVFIAFSGEEMGLLGSNYFVNHSAVPLEKIVAMLNMDMIGRLPDGSQLQVFGTKTAPEFDALVSRDARDLGFTLKTSGGGFGPSDHTSFYAKKIPVLHFFTGLHNDYHRPTDDVEKINADGGARVLQLVYEVGETLASDASRPTYVAVAESRPARTGAKVRMGVMPSYAEDEQVGMSIDGVSPGSPAERAGLQSGDRLLMVGPHTVNNVYDLMDAMGHYEPGNEASLTVLRQGDRIQLPLKFEAP